MRKILIFIGLFICFALIGQGMNVMHPTHRVISVSAAAPVAEMITDGAFAASTYWSFGTSWSFVSNSGYFDDGSSGGLGQTDGNMVSSIIALTRYHVTFDISNCTGTAQIRIDNSDLSINYLSDASYANGTHELNIITPADVGVGGIAFRASSSGTTDDFNLDNVSLKARVLGSETVTDGDFPDNTNWTEGGNWNIAGGVATYTDGTSSDLYQVDGDMAISLEVSEDYQMTFDISSTGVAGFSLSSSDNGVSYLGAATYADGSHTVQITLPADIGIKGLRFDTSSSLTTADFSITNVSIKKWTTPS